MEFSGSKRTKKKDKLYKVEVAEKLEFHNLPHYWDIGVKNQHQENLS